MKMSESIVKIAPALLAAQKEMGDATKGSKNPFFKSSYADLNSIREVVTPELNKNDITVLQPTVHIDGRSFVQTLLLHSSGEFISSETEVICAKQNDPQALGSAISYARRYGLQSMLSVGAVDSDAEDAMDRKPAKVQQKTVLAAKPDVTLDNVDNVTPSKEPVKKASFLKKKEEPKTEDGWE